MVPIWLLPQPSDAFQTAPTISDRSETDRDAFRRILSRQLDDDTGRSAARTERHQGTGSREKPGTSDQPGAEGTKKTKDRDRQTESEKGVWEEPRHTKTDADRSVGANQAKAEGSPAVDRHNDAPGRQTMPDRTDDPLSDDDLGASGNRDSATSDDRRSQDIEVVDETELVLSGIAGEEAGASGANSVRTGDGTPAPGAETAPHLAAAMTSDTGATDLGGPEGPEAAAEKDTPEAQAAEPKLEASPTPSPDQTDQDTGPRPVGDSASPAGADNGRTSSALSQSSYVEPGKTENQIVNGRPEPANQEALQRSLSATNAGAPDSPAGSNGPQMTGSEAATMTTVEGGGNEDATASATDLEAANGGEEGGPTPNGEDAAGGDESGASPQSEMTGTDAVSELATRDPTQAAESGPESPESAPGLVTVEGDAADETAATRATAESDLGARKRAEALAQDSTAGGTNADKKGAEAPRDSFADALKQQNQERRDARTQQGPAQNGESPQPQRAADPARLDTPPPPTTQPAGPSPAKPTADLGISNRLSMDPAQPSTLLASNDGSYDGQQPGMGSHDSTAQWAAGRPIRLGSAPAGVPGQLLVHIRRAVSQGQQRLSVQLQPEELGRINITLDFGKDGRVRASLVVERAQTLELLQKDARSIERMLQDAGLETDGESLSFSLNDDGGFEDQLKQHRDTQSRPRRKSSAAIETPAPVDVTQMTWAAPGRLDLRV